MKLTIKIYESSDGFCAMVTRGESSYEIQATNRQERDLALQGLLKALGVRGA